MPRTKRSMAGALSTYAKNIDKRIEEEDLELEEVPTKKLIPSVSTLLNLACSDNHRGSFGMGKMMNLVGESAAGKTLLSKSFFSMMASQKRFDDYLFIYDDAENADEFNDAKMFGKKAAKRIKAPAYKGTEKVSSRTIEDFDLFVHSLLEAEIPFFYVLDSWDAIGAEADLKKARENRKRKAKGKELKGGGYNVAKQKKASQIMGGICAKLKKTNSGLLVLSQTRDNLEQFSFEKKIRSGGNALRFYASHEVWLDMVGKIPRKKRVVGNKVRCTVKKNKITGKVREVRFPIYYDLSGGVDDIRSCIEFMVNEGNWTCTGTGVTPACTINAKDFEEKLKYPKLIQFIEENNLEKELSKITAITWHEIEESIKEDRKRRFE